MNILGFDIGVKKIGVAIASTILKQARPLGLIEVKTGWERQIIGLLKQWQIQAVVIGDPGDRPENKHVQAKIAAVEDLIKKSALVDLIRWPEDYSSQEARLEQEYYPQQSLDAIAAMLVLQAYLDACQKDSR